MMTRWEAPPDLGCRVGATENGQNGDYSITPWRSPRYMGLRCTHAHFQRSLPWPSTEGVRSDG
jgi:hypothetical protein